MAIQRLCYIRSDGVMPPAQLLTLPTLKGYGVSWCAREIVLSDKFSWQESYEVGVIGVTGKDFGLGAMARKEEVVVKAKACGLTLFQHSAAFQIASKFTFQSCTHAVVLTEPMNYGGTSRLFTVRHRGNGKNSVGTVRDFNARLWSGNTLWLFAAPVKGEVVIV